MAGRSQMTRTIRFKFHERKATAAAALLLRLGGGRMEYLKLIKLLYYADRESLDRLGRPISGDRYVSMKHGPVLSNVYDLVKQTISGKPPKGCWADAIISEGRYALKLKTEPDVGALSEAEIELIERVYADYGASDRWDVRDRTHKLPEWGDPGASSREIGIEQILQVLGKSEDEIDEVRQRASEERHFDRIFAR